MYIPFCFVTKFNTWMIAFLSKIVHFVNNCVSNFCLLELFPLLSDFYY